MRKMKRRARRRQRPALGRRLAWSAVAVAGCLSVLTAGTLRSLHGSVLAAAGAVAPPFGGKKAVNILVLGVDDGEGGLGRSDTMLLAHVDTAAHRVSALSIPRDTRVALGGHRWGKI